jgi:hypothetical protein
MMTGRQRSCGSFRLYEVWEGLPVMDVDGVVKLKFGDEGDDASIDHGFGNRLLLYQESRDLEGGIRKFSLKPIQSQCNVKSFPVLD